MRTIAILIASLFVTANLLYLKTMEKIEGSTKVTLSKKVQGRSINIVLNVLPSVRPAFLPIFKQFEEETGIRVIPQKFVEDFDFKENMHQWLVEGKDTPDVLYGHNDMRLQKMAQLGAVHPITHLWHKNNWHSKFRKEQIQGSSYAGEQFALPYSMYTWGLFYKTKITKKLGPVPKTWEAFKTYCQKLKRMGISPFPASKKQPYIAAAWFEYLVLRIHGLDFFNQVMQGEISFVNNKVQQIFIEWQDLISKGFFDTSFYHMRWEQYLPYFLRDEIGFVLMGTPLASRIFDQDIKEEVEFMPFPKIKNIPRYETAPSNVFFIAANSKKIADSEQFIEFLSQVEIQNVLSNFLHSSPARLGAKTANDKYALKGFDSINSAQGLSPFFDRGAEPDFERKAVVSFAKFLKTGDIEQLTQELESARLSVYHHDIYSLNLSAEKTLYVN